MFLVEVIPPILLGSVAGVFVDRWDRRWTMIGANVVRGLLLLPLLVFSSAEQIWIVYVVAFLESVVNLFFGPANNALLPQLVKEDELVTANSLDALGENAARIIGPAIGGALLAAVGLGAVAITDVASYLIGGVLIFFIRAPQVAREASKRSIRAEWTGFWKDWLAGLRLVLQHRPLSFAFLAVGIALIGDAIFGVLLVVFVQDVVELGPKEFGWILTARGVGGILGGLIVARVGSRLKPKNLIAYGMAGVGVVLILLLQFPELPVVLVAAVAVGLPAMAYLIAGQTWLQTHSRDEYRGRVFGAFETYAAFMGLIGIGFATLGGEALGVITSLYISAVLFLTAGALAFFILRDKVIESHDEQERTFTSTK
jgi:predicted MFS family arabinose efflux permease